MKPKQYNKGGALKPVPSEKKGLSKLPTEVRNKMGYMMGGGKLDKMYQNGGKTDPPRKLSPDAMRLVKLGEVAKAQRDAATAAKTEKTFMNNARMAGAEALTEMRNALKSEGPASVAKFDKELKEKGYRVILNDFVISASLGGSAQKPVKKMMAGGKMEYAIGGMMKNKVKRLENREANLVARGSKAVDEGRERKADRLLGRAARVENRVIKAKESAPVKKMMGGGKMDMMYQKGGKVSTPYNKTKDNNSYISNDVDMNPSTKKQMMALRSALMYFTGVSPKNK